MAQIVIRNLHEAVLAALREVAALSGASIEEQARRALAKAVALDREAAVRRLDEVPPVNRPPRRKFSRR